MGLFPPTFSHLKVLCPGYSNCLGYLYSQMRKKTPWERQLSPSISNFLKVPVSLHWLHRNSKQHKRNLRHDSVVHTQASRNNFSISYHAWYTYIQHWHADFWCISLKLWKVPKGIYLWVIALFMTYLWVIALYPSTLTSCLTKITKFLNGTFAFKRSWEGKQKLLKGPKILFE